MNAAFQQNTSVLHQLDVAHFIELISTQFAHNVILMKLEQPALKTNITLRARCKLKGAMQISQTARRAY